MLSVVLVLWIAGATSVPAPACARDSQIPAAVPVVPCPTLVMPAPCHWCPRGVTFLALHYDMAAAPLVESWAEALRGAGWKLTWNRGNVINGTLGEQRVSLHLAPGSTPDTTVIRLTFSP